MPYFKPNNRKYKNVVQNSSTTKTSRKLQFRLSGDDLLLFGKHKQLFNVLNESDFIRDKLMDSIYKDEIKLQEYEIDGI